jgi:hypothetical protein
VLALAAGAALLLAACSSNPSPDAATSTTGHQGTVQTVVTTTSTTSSPASTSTTPTTAVSAACNHVTASAGQMQGAAGTFTGIVTITNTGPTPCTTNGYPKISLYSGSGAPLTVTMVDGLSVQVSAAANGAPSSVTLQPNQMAQFAYQGSDVPVGNETSCPVSESASVVLPGVTDDVVSAVRLGGRAVRQRHAARLAGVRRSLTRRRRDPATRLSRPPGTPSRGSPGRVRAPRRRARDRAPRSTRPTRSPR